MKVKEKYLTTVGGWRRKLDTHLEDSFWAKQDKEPTLNTHELEPPATEGSPKFQYDELQQGYTRFFQLVLNDETEPLCGRLMSTSNSDNELDWSHMNPKTMWNDDSATNAIRKTMTGSEKFDALSYCWGPPKPHSWLYLSTVSDHYKSGSDKTIQIDHEPERNGWIEINSALSSFLREVRRRKIRRFIWIDAICINQNDSQEKSMQIPMMRSIYESASVVRVWLGEGTELERHAMTQLSAIAEKMQVAFEAAPDTLDPAEDDSFHRADLPLPSDPVWNGIGTLMTRPYWSRLWTLQEVAVHKEFTKVIAEIVCGAQSLPMSTFERLSAACATRELRTWILTGKTGVMSTSLHGFDALAEIFTCGESYNWGVRIDNLVPIILRREATVAADKILGLLALVDHTTARHVAADITESAQTIFMKFAKFYVRNGAREPLLNHVTTEETLPGLPSWCPNFASSPQAFCLGTRWFGRAKLSENHKKQVYRAGFQLEGKWAIPRHAAQMLKRTTNLLSGKNNYTGLYEVEHPQKMTLVPDSDWLLTRGMHIDTIAAVVDLNTDVDSYNYLSSTSMQRILEWDAKCLEVAKKYVPEGTEGFDMYARTLVANRIRLDLIAEGPSSVWDTGTIPLFDDESTYDFVTPYFAFKKYLQAVTSSVAASLDASTTSRLPHLDHHAKNYFQTVVRVTRNRRFFATKSGLIGLGPRAAEVGDKVVVLFFTPTPYVLRETATSIRHHLVGECYVHGYMYGQALDRLDRGEIGESSWVLE